MSDNEVSTANGEYQMEVFTDSATMSGITGQKVEERIGSYFDHFNPFHDVLEGESDETDSSEDEGFNVIGETVITPTILKAQASFIKPSTLMITRINRQKRKRRKKQRKQTKSHRTARARKTASQAAKRTSHSFQTQKSTRLTINLGRNQALI